MPRGDPHPIPSAVGSRIGGCRDDRVGVARMSIQDLGSIGELLAAIATIATLAYLAVQLRQNTASVRASSAVAYTEAIRSTNLVIVQDPELVELFWSGLANRAALNDENRRRFDFLISSQTQSFEQTWRFREEGVIDDATWKSQQVGISWFAHQPGFIDYIGIYGGMLHPGFAAELEKAMAEELSPEIAIAAQQNASADPLRDPSQA